MRGLVLAGGHGTRLRPLTFSGNKHMIPVANQPILFYSLGSLARAGIRDVTVVLGPIVEGIRESVGDGSRFGLNVEYVVQGEPRGLAHAVKCARPSLGDDPFLMHLGDNLLQSGVEPFLSRFHSETPQAVIGVASVAHPENYGVVELKDGRIASVQEKPAAPRSHLALVGVYLFDPSIHRVIDSLRPSQRGELEITEAIAHLVEGGKHVSVLEVTGWWKDTGRPDDLLEANELVLDRMPRELMTNQGETAAGAILEGACGVGKGSRVGAGSRIVGPCVIGAGVRVMGTSTIGPYCAIGDNAVVTDASIRRSIVLEGAQVSGVSVANSILGKGVEVMAKQRSDRELTLTVGDSCRILL